MRLVCSQWPNIKVTSTQTIHRLTAHLFYESLWHPRLFGFSHPSKRSHRTACEISTRLAGPREQTFWNGLLPLNQSWVQVIPQKLTQQKQENKLSSSSKKQHPHGRGPPRGNPHRIHRFLLATNSINGALWNSAAQGRRSDASLKGALHGLAMHPP